MGAERNGASLNAERSTERVQKSLRRCCYVDRILVVPSMCMKHKCGIPEDFYVLFFDFFDSSNDERMTSTGIQLTYGSGIQ